MYGDTQKSFQDDRGENAKVGQSILLEPRTKRAVMDQSRKSVAYSFIGPAAHLRSVFDGMPILG